MTTTPMMMPMLARGKHRKPRRGACFMELASYLAGQPWSDHPACTDPALAQLARLVNDLTTDAGRPQLAPMIPSVIGIVDLGDEYIEEVAVIAALRALPIAALEHQHGLGVGLLRILGDSGPYPVAVREPWRSRAEAELADHTALRSWSVAFMRRMKIALPPLSVAIPLTVIAARAISEACVGDPDAELRAVLGEAIDWARACAGSDAPEASPLEPHQWAGMVRSA
ncbi:hypothetical protein GCG21_09585 [Pseudactinotalea sp. HY160]|uniref:hypothetical protein n=1 Tax=Pseudactinotalea sp. HY160 TaxID=2654490 RepID=UPI00128E3472|nr:hypothetical protein [Pseudactinotalea sp. HY160]MPV50249.1 hypothetical protein [Pseudactinotalea sp. HY160]